MHIYVKEYRRWVWIYIHESFEDIWFPDMSSLPPSPLPPPCYPDLVENLEAKSSEVPGADCGGDAPAPAWGVHV